MGFINTPIKTIGAALIGLTGLQTLPWDDQSQYPVVPGSPLPPPILREFTWVAEFLITAQTHSSTASRLPGQYDGIDVTVGQWVADSVTGEAWQIIEVREKTPTYVKVVLQDVYRYNTYRDPAGTGFGIPNVGNYIIFNLSDAGLPQIDPVPEFGISAYFSQNLSSRFEYINTQYDFALYQTGNTFKAGDVISANDITNSFVLADNANRIVVGRVTSVSNVKEGWFTVNPVQKIVDFLDWLPGDVGDIIYSDGTQLTTANDGPQVYVKLRNNTQSVTTGNSITPASTGAVMQLNGVDVTFTGSTMADTADDINSVYAETGVYASLVFPAQSIVTGEVTNIYGEPALYAISNPASIRLNGILVTFNIASTEPGYTEYARPAEMARSINQANIPNIIAVADPVSTLRITNTSGGEIYISDQLPDSNGVNFAGANSATGFQLHTPAVADHVLCLTADDSRAINLLDVLGTPTAELGIVSVENGIKAAGMYIKDGLRNATSTVVSNLAQLNQLNPVAGDSAFVIDSVDVDGNNSGEWSLRMYDGAYWVIISNQDSAATDAKSLEYTFAYNAPAETTVGHISTGRRVTLITVEVTEAFDNSAALSIGYDINNSAPVSMPSGLMRPEIIDLTVPGIYTCSSSILFGTDTPSGDVTVTATYDSGGATTGTAQIIVSYI